MAIIARIAFIAISMVLLCSVAMAADYTVGDDKGWTVDQNYTDWAKDKVFHVGDNLFFNYDKSKHNVMKVNGIDFKNCNTSAVTNGETLNSGNDKVTLITPGKKWYICGFTDHCFARHMKLVIHVVAADEPAAAPSSAPSPVSPLFLLAVVAVASFFAG